MKPPTTSTSGVAFATALAPSPEDPLPVVYGGFWRRYFAVVIDFAIVFAAVVPTSVLFIWLMEAIHGDLRMKRDHALYLSGIGAVAFLVIGDWLYNALQMSSVRQATLGKRWLGLRVANHHGLQVSFLQASARHFCKFLSAFSVIGFLMAIWTNRHQALHDIVADTFVVRDE